MYSIPIRVVFATTSNWWSAVHRWLTGAAASRVLLLYYDEDFDTECVLELVAGGGRIATFESFKKQNQIVKIWTPAKSLHEGLVGMVAFLEERLSWRARMRRWLGYRWAQPWTSFSHALCSEAVVRVLVGASYPGTEYMDTRTTSVEDLLLFTLREDLQCRPPV